jgi:hypothetical protein
MGESRYDCDCDLVVAMEEAGVGVEEILQYSRGCLTPDEIRLLIYGLERMVEEAAVERVG